MLDLAEDPNSSDEEMNRLALETEPGGTGRVDDVIDACRRRIAAWQPPGDAHTPEEEQAAVGSYMRLRRLASCFDDGAKVIEAFRQHIAAWQAPPPSTRSCYGVN